MEVIEQVPQSAVTRQDDGVRERLHCTVWLPGVTSVSEFSVTIKPGSLRLHAPGRYLLDLRLDAAVEERPEELKFVKKRCELKCVLLVVDAPQAPLPVIPPAREPHVARPEQPTLHESFLAEAARLAGGNNRSKSQGKGKKPAPAQQAVPAHESWQPDVGGWQQAARRARRRAAGEVGDSESDAPSQEAAAGEGVDAPGTPPSELHQTWLARGEQQPDSDDAEPEPAAAPVGAEAAAADADAAAVQECLAAGAMDAMRAGDHARAASLARQARAAGSRDARLLTLLQMCEMLAAAPDGPGGGRAAAPVAAAAAGPARPALRMEPQAAPAAQQLQPQPQARPAEPKPQPQPSPPEPAARASLAQTAAPASPAGPVAPAADEAEAAEPQASASAAAESAPAAGVPAEPCSQPQASPSEPAEAPAAEAPAAEPAEASVAEAAEAPAAQPAEAPAAPADSQSQPAARPAESREAPQQPPEPEAPQQSQPEPAAQPQPEPAPQTQPHPVEAGPPSGKGNGQAKSKGGKKQQPPQQQQQQQQRPQQARRQDGQAGKGGSKAGKGGKGGKEAQQQPQQAASPKPVKPAKPPTPEPKRAANKPKPAAKPASQRAGKPGVLRRAWLLLAWLVGLLSAVIGTGLEMGSGCLALLTKLVGLSSLSAFLLDKQDESSFSGMAVQIVFLLVFAGICYVACSAVLLCGAVVLEIMLLIPATGLYVAAVGLVLAWDMLLLLFWAPTIWSSAIASLVMLLAYPLLGSRADWTFYISRLWSWPLAAWAAGGGLAGWAQLWPCFLACLNGPSLLGSWVPPALVRGGLAWAGAPAWVGRWGAFLAGLAWAFFARRVPARRSGKPETGAGGGGDGRVPKGASGEVARVLEAADFYQVLEVPQSADGDALRAAKRAKALLTHPDKLGAAPGATEAFRRVTEAYELLSDGDRRAAYDSELKWRKEEQRAESEEQRTSGMSVPCPGCLQKHWAPFLDRPLSAARWCDACATFHPASEGDFWLESRSRTWLGRRRIQTLLVLAGRVADVSGICGWRMPDLGSLPVNAHDCMFDVNELRSGGAAGQPPAGRKGRKGRRK